MRVDYATAFPSGFEAMLGLEAPSERPLGDLERERAKASCSVTCHGLSCCLVGAA